VIFREVQNLLAVSVSIYHNTIQDLLYITSTYLDPR
jgi:hypothetical protein